MTDQLKSFVQTFKKAKPSKTVAEEMKRINRNNKDRINYKKKYNGSRFCVGVAEI